MCTLIKNRYIVNKYKYKGDKAKFSFIIKLLHNNNET